MQNKEMGDVNGLTRNACLCEIKNKRQILNLLFWVTSFKVNIYNLIEFKQIKCLSV